MIKTDLVTAIDLLGIDLVSNSSKTKRGIDQFGEMRVLEPSSFIDFAILMALYYL